MARWGRIMGLLLATSLLCTACTVGSRSSDVATTTQPLPTAATPSATPLAFPTPIASPTAIDTPTAINTPTIAATPVATPSPGPTACGETRGTIVHTQLRSKAMGHAETYRVYTPACYRHQSRRYAVIYLLHGGEHNDEHWDDVGVDEAADELIAAGTIAPVLIVLPDGGQDFGPLRGNPPPFAGYLHDELIPHIDATYRTLGDREHRALGGISYGAAWALLLAARYPDAFGAVGAHSPAIGTFNGIYPDVGALAAGNVRIYIDVGDRDGLRKPAAAFDAALTDAGVTHEFHVFRGSHIESYWNSHLEDYLRFYTYGW